MGWGGAYGGGQATVGSFFFLGGFCTVLASVGNFILGNTFPATFLGIYGGFFLSLGLTLTPSSGSANTDVYPKGPEDPGFMAAFGRKNRLSHICGLELIVCLDRILRNFHGRLYLHSLDRVIADKLGIGTHLRDAVPDICGPWSE
jgi:hypothetical protein